MGARLHMLQVIPSYRCQVLLTYTMLQCFARLYQLHIRLQSQVTRLHARLPGYGRQVTHVTGYSKLQVPGSLNIHNAAVFCQVIPVTHQVTVPGYQVTRQVTRLRAPGYTCYRLFQVTGARFS